MQSALSNIPGLCRQQNVLKPCQCSTSGSSIIATHTAAATHRARVQFAAQAAAIGRGATQITAQASTSGRTASSSKPRPWKYKYKHHPCPSLCSPDDMLCLEVEALIQNVLSFPNLPGEKLHRALPDLTADINSMTALVEQMARHFGKELTLCYLRKQPRLLNLDFETVLARCNSIREMCGIRDSDIPQLLRKNPSLLLKDPHEAKAALENIPRVVNFTPMQVRQLVTKFPLIITMNPQSVAQRVERLKQLCYTREEWARDYESISPSLLAYFLRDATDQLLRLEYLASTGERPEWQLREVMKPANRSFRSKLRNFAQWEMHVKQRRAQARAAAAAVAQQAAQQAEAAVIKAELLAADDAGAQQQGTGKQHKQAP